MGIYPDREKPLEVKIEVFEGPLELLLHLIRKKKVSIDELNATSMVESYMLLYNIITAKKPDGTNLIDGVNNSVVGYFLSVSLILLVLATNLTVAFLGKYPI